MKLRLASPSSLARRGVLGMNRRNCDYVLAHNRRASYPLVDDKLRTKRRAEEAGIAVPTLRTVIESHFEISQFLNTAHGLGDFVVKPSKGSGGKGIVVIEECSRSRFVKPDGTVLDRTALSHHLSNILSGLYSLGGRRDKAMVEQRVRFDPVFESVSYLGVPDIRILVYLGYPAMAMMRLATKASDGRANLHQGAVGVGIDIATGGALFGVCRGFRVDRHPDTGAPLAGLRVPGWDSLLDLAAGCFDVFGLGYLGCDIVLDVERGPLILELNARPGLSIQLANGAGLRPRLQAIERRAGENPGEPTSRKIAFIKDAFSPQEPPIPSSS